jgi:F-type H+-transporting ATPase subunit b
MTVSPTMDDLVESVANMPEVEEVFYLSAEFWVSVTFVIVVGILYSPLAKKAKELLLKRIERIKKELSDAENIKLEAQNLYADTERKLSNIDKEIEDIVANKKYLIEETKNKKISELNYAIQRKKADLDAEIEQTSAQIEQEVKTLVCQKTIRLLHQIISAKLTKKEYSALIDKSIQNIKNMNIGV